MNSVFDFLNINRVSTSFKNVITDERPDNERIENFEEIMSFARVNGMSDLVDLYFDLEKH